jgi:hypothetical protein
MLRDGFVLVRFVESEDITRYGVAKTTYRVLMDRVWIEVARAPQAIVTRSPSRAGTVWSRIVEIPLALGTQVERCIEAPRARPTKGSTLDILLGRSSTQKSSCRRERLVVTSGGNLRRVEREA